MLHILIIIDCYSVYNMYLYYLYVPCMYHEQYTLYNYTMYINRV